MKSFCKNCESLQPSSFRLEHDAETRKPYEDLCCNTCHFVVATVQGREALAQPAQEPHEYDWSMLEAAKESLREHMARIKELEAQLAQPAQEPVARVTGVYGGRFTYEPINPAMVLPVGMALYAGPA
jgi:hypothetical protein